MRTCKNLGWLCVLDASIATAQILEPPNVMPGGYGQWDLGTQRVVPYPHIREADVMWHKRVWRDIDATEKINLPLFYPMEPTDGRASLFDVIKHAVLADEPILTAFDPGVDGWSDEFTRILSHEELRERLFRSEVITVEGLDGEFRQDTITSEVGPGEVRRWRLKEDWIFDKQRSRMDIRIIGIAPLKVNTGPDGEVRGYQPIFWLYFPEVRYVIANAPAFNPWNDGQQRSFDHMFATRMFNSTVIKASNVYDRPIAEFKSGIDGVLESDAIKQELFEFEHDLWQY